MLFFYRERQMGLILFLLNHQLPRRWRWTSTSQTQGKPAGNVWPVVWRPWHYSGHYNINTVIPKETEGSKWFRNKFAPLYRLVSPRFSKSSLHADRRQNWHGNWEVYFYFYVSFFCFRNLPIGLHTFYTKHKLCFTTKFGRSTFK